MFTSRRKPKRINRDEPEVPENDTAEEGADGPVVKRPGAPAKTKSKLRMSFQVDEIEDEGSGTVKRTTSRPTQLPRFNENREDDTARPTYSKDALKELKSATQSTPQDLQLTHPTSQTDLDIASKFGISSSATTSSIIPSAAEIQEKKDRRARLALEQKAGEDFIPLDDYDSDGEFKPRRMQVGMYTGDDSKSTRLVRDDEDFAEGFDEFTENKGRLTIGEKTATQQRKEREAMREMIDMAEGSEEDESDSETERNHAFESAQTRHGMEGLSSTDQQRHKAESNRPRQPRETTPIPKLATALSRLRESLQKIEMEKIRIEKRRADLRNERAEIKASQDHIQQSLEEAGRELEKLQLSEPGYANGTAPERGLENIGTPT